MKTLPAKILMLCSMIGLMHILVVTGLIFPALYARTLGMESALEASTLMLGPTKFATDHFWIFPVILAIACVAFIAAVSRWEAKAVELLISGLCAQGLIVWAAAFCFCFDIFTGPMCLHHGPEFELGLFFTACFGIFPVTLATLLVPIAAVFCTEFFKNKKRKVKQGDAKDG
jgi:hypothetical protein